ncbi:energy-coupling factor transporter transmembrane component T [Clostridium neuense]|uniref:Energy-coupling factor transporter transmembrane component T n=1 Tax=Clostridium neuense TaxID=1728934 RepID=A0ABW8TI89_9CLOT
MNKLHVISPVNLCLALLIITFLEDNPLVIFCIFAFVVTNIIKSHEFLKLKSAFIYFIPIAIVTIIINMLFVSKGSFVLVNIWGRYFTLEAVIYAFTLTLKLLVVIYIFLLLGILIDSDAAVSYFLSKIPKTTLAMMIGFKFFPAMQERLKNIKMIYKIRGVEFESGNLKSKVKGVMEILSVLLEDSLETFFNIAETSYVRGFLSGKRTMYEKQKFHKKDYMFMLVYLSYSLCFLVVHLLGLDKFEIYSQGINKKSFFNLSVYTFIVVTLLSLILLLRKSNRVES